MRHGSALLAGGRGSRMGGVNKAELGYMGRSFAVRIAGELERTGFPCYMSIAEYDQALPEGWTAVKDEVTDSDVKHIGPMGGIYSCLKRAEADGLNGMFFAPCDAPFFRREIIERLAGSINEETEAACWRTSDGRIQTTFGWYSVKLIPILEEDIRNHHFKILKSIEKSKMITIDTRDYGIEEKMFLNINTEADYARIIQDAPECRHILICGRPGSGKTTLISRIVSETKLPVCGYKTAVASIDDKGVKTIRMYPVRTKANRRTEGAVVGHTQNKVIDVDHDTFDDLGVRLINERNDNGVLIMDEIGYMEIGSERFCREVIKAFDDRSNIIAAIKAEDHGYKYLKLIKNHPDAALIELTEDNRQEVYMAVKEIVRGWEKKHQKGDELS